MLPEDDMRYAIETSKSSLSVLSANHFRLIYDIQLVHLLVCNIQGVMVVCFTNRMEHLCLLC